MVIWSKLPNDCHYVIMSQLRENYRPIVEVL